MEYILEVTDRKRLLAPLPFEIARLKAWFLQLLPNPLLTVDQVRQLAHDNVVSEAAIKDGRTLEGIGIDPHAIESVVPTYLARFRRGRPVHRTGSRCTRLVGSQALSGIDEPQKYDAERQPVDDERRHARAPQQRHHEPDRQEGRLLPTGRPPPAHRRR